MKGMTKDQVRSALGSPSYTNEMTLFDTWSYQPVFDEESQAVGGDAHVSFTKEGRVIDVTF